MATILGAPSDAPHLIPISSAISQKDRDRESGIAEGGEGASLAASPLQPRGGLAAPEPPPQPRPRASWQRRKQC
jgi:hypothetical protein